MLPHSKNCTAAFLYIPVLSCILCGFRYRFAAPMMPALFPRIAHRTSGINAFSPAKHTVFMYAVSGPVSFSFWLHTPPKAVPHPGGRY